VTCNLSPTLPREAMLSLQADFIALLGSAVLKATTRTGLEYSPLAKVQFFTWSRKL
jgi:hypothetical protein